MDRATAELVAELRHMIADEIPLTLHLFPGRQPGTPKKGAEPTYGSSTGLPFTNPFARYLGHYDGWGSSRPGTRAILETDEWCRSRHPGHRRGDLPTFCAALLWSACYWRRDVPTLLEPDLTKAIRHASTVWADKRLAKLDEPLPYARLTRAPAARTRQRAV